MRTASVALVLIVVVIWVISRRITEPISLISAAVQQLAEGRLDVRVQGVRTRDEIGEFARTFNRMVADLSQHVAALTEQTAAREAVQSELRVARNIQNRLLPQRFPAFPDRREFDLYAVNDPVRTVAGDFYDYFLVDDSTLAVCIADVSGKGVPASLFMAVTSTLVRNLAPRCDTPGQVLFEANRQLLRDSEGAMFVTLLLGFYNIHTGEMRYANAAHPLPYLLAANQPPKQVGRSTGTVLGMVDDAGFEDDVTVIEPGSSLVFYTDGVPEARGPGGRFLDDEGFESILTRLQADSSPQQVCRHILSGVQLFQADTPPSDDITLLVLQRSGDQPSPSTAGHNPEHTSAAVR